MRVISDRWKKNAEQSGRETEASPTDGEKQENSRENVTIQLDYEIST